MDVDDRSGWPRRRDYDICSSKEVIMWKRRLVLAFVAMLSPAVLGDVIVDDHFDDGVIGTNTTGIGTGFNSWDIGWSGNVTEANSRVTLNGPVHGGSRASMTSKDGAGIGPGISRFEFRDVSFAVGNTSSGTTARDCVGVKDGDAAWDYDQGLPTGFWIQFENTALTTPTGAGGWDGTSVLFYESSTDGKTVLATWSFDTLNWYPGARNLTPVLDVTLDITSTSYSLTIEGDSITLLSGAMSGTFANELTTGYATAYIQSENPGIDILMDQIVITEDAPAPVLARLPRPEDGETDVLRDAPLSWTPGPFASTHDVYLGTTFEDVDNASRTAPGIVLVSKDQSDTTYNAGHLEFGTTYYWRVDEVNAPDKPGTYKGQVWSFTVEPYSYPITPTAATASSSMGSSMGPTKTINRSGLNASDQHSIAITDMWVSSKTGPQPTWIQYEFDRVRKLDQMWVWNSNQAVEEIVGYGVKQARVEVSTDGTTWTEVPNVPEFAQATGQIDYVHNTTVDLGGAVAQYVRLTCLSTWGGGEIYSLSEVRFFEAPTRARGPEPTNAATGVDVDATLNWRPGREAARHEVYLGTDPNALVLAQTVTDHQVALTALGGQYGQTYYWRVNEVNDAALPQSWEGDVWTLSTPTYKVVDDFEAYNDQCNRVYYAWKGGAGNSENADCGQSAYGGNGTGSIVGNDNPPYAERTHVHSGAQAMPFSYDNTSGSGVSEAVLTFSPAQDWTAGGLKTLVLFFKGDLANGAGQVYVKINGTKVSYTGNAAALTTGLWNQWNVDLSSLSVQAVSSLTVGVSGTGKGVLYVDDIRLYREAPAVVVPSDPGQTGLVAWYSMEGSVQDGSGNGNNGTLVGAPTYGTSLAGLGTALGLNGVSDCVDLGNKAAFNPAGSLGISLWASIGDWGTAWNHVMVGNRGESNVGWQVRRHSSTSLCFTTRGVGQDDTASVLTPPLNEWIHITCVYEQAANTKTIYVNGTPDTVVTTNTGAKVAATTHNTYIGARAVGGNTGPEAFFTGMLDDIRIYNRALSEAEARYLAGDR